MKKTGFLAVSLAALMIVGAARADIASTTYVDNIAKTKQDKLSIDTLSTYDANNTNNDSRIPTVKVAEKIAGAAVTTAAVNYATKDELATEKSERTSADSALGDRIDAEVTARTNADNAIDKKIGTVPTGKDVVTMISDAQTAATYDDTAVKNSINTINNSDVMKSGATKAKIDAIATNTSAINAINNTTTGILAQAKGYTDSEIDKLDAAKQDKLGYTAENAANRTGTIAAAATASDIKYPNEKAVATALAGKQDNLTSAQLAAANSGITSSGVTQITTNKNDIAKLNGADTVTGSVAQQIKAATDTINANVDKKADKATTLAGYGITDAATSGQLSSLSSTVATNKTNTDKAISDEVTRAKAAEKANADNISMLQTGKQDKLTASNIKGSGSVTVDVADTGVITVSGTDTKYTLPIATADKLGGVKAGGDISVNATTGVVTVNNAAKATSDGTGANIANTYATKTALSAVQATANAALPKATYDSQVGTVSATNMGTTATTVVGGIKEAVDEAAAAQNTANAAKTTANAALPKATYDSQVGTVSAANMGTTATTVVTGIKEAVTEAAAAQTTATSALSKANAAIPQPSGSCTDCVLHFNGTAFSWEEIGR